MKKKMIFKPLFLLLLFLNPLTMAWAQWQVSYPDPDNDADVPVAYIENSQGYRIEISQEQGVVRGTFQLRNGFDVFPDDGCPTLRIDNNQPIDMFVHALSCIASGSTIAFTLGQITDNRITSLVLAQLKSGNHVVLQFPLVQVGYQETGFSLKQSGYALDTVLGKGLHILAR